MLMSKESAGMQASVLPDAGADAGGRATLTEEGIDGDSLTEFPAGLVEGDTVLHMRRAALFETEYHAEGATKPIVSVLWFNADATGFMDETKGDRILSIDCVST